MGALRTHSRRAGHTDVSFFADGRGILDRVGIDKGLQAVEERIAVALAAPGKKLMFYPGQIKLFADGAIISQLMQMKDGYLDGHKGEWIILPTNSKSGCVCSGTPATRSIFTSTATSVSKCCRHHRETAGGKAAHRPPHDHRAFRHLTEEQVARIARLGAIVSANRLSGRFRRQIFEHRSGSATGGCDGAISFRREGERAAPSYPTADAPSAPLTLAWCGVNRVTPSGRVAGPDQRIGVHEALRAITIEAAIRGDRRTGSVRSRRARSPISRCLTKTPRGGADGLKDIPVGAPCSKARSILSRARLRQRRRWIAVARLWLSSTASAHPIAASAHQDSK